MKAKDILHRIFLITLIVTTTTFIFFGLSLSKADGTPYAATQIIGQVDGSFAPIFTSTSPNSGMNPVDVSTNSYGLNYPSILRIDSTRHKLYLADMANYRVLVYELNSNNTLEDYQADYVIGRPDFTSYLEPVAATDHTFAPGGMDLDVSNNRLFVVDTAFSLAVAKTGGFDRVLVFDLNNLQNGMSASYVIGKPTFIDGDASSDISQSNLSQLLQTKYDSSNERLFVSTQQGRVLVFDVRQNGSADKTICGYVSNGIADGMNASCVIGQPNFTANSEALLFQPFGMDIDSNGFLFLAEPVTSRVLVFDVRPDGSSPTTKCSVTTSGIVNDIQPSCVIGQPDLVTFDVGTTQNTLFTPSDVHAINGNRLLVTDQSNRRVLFFDYSEYSIQPNAYFVIGELDYVTNDYGLFDPPSASIIKAPVSTFYDSENDRIYVVDTTGNRVMVYNFIKISTSQNISDGQKDSYYSKAIDAINYQGNLSFSVTPGYSLPGGLSINSETGVISGTPTVSGSYSFSITVSDVLTLHTFTDSKVFNISIAEAPSVVLLPDIIPPIINTPDPIIPPVIIESTAVIPQVKEIISAIIKTEKKMITNNITKKEVTLKENNPFPVPVIVPQDHNQISYVYKNLFIASFLLNIFLIFMLLVVLFVHIYENHVRHLKSKKTATRASKSTKK